jgi:flagellin
MGLRIKTNISSIMAQRNMSRTGISMRENMQKMSSGYRINKAADDAAGLAISNNMNAKTRSLEQASRNAADGISLISIAEGGMNEMTDMLIRLRELATQAASDTISNVERSFTNREYTQLVSEIERIANTTDWNGMKLLKGSDANPGEGLITLHVGAGDGQTPNTDTLFLDIDEMSLNPVVDLRLGVEAEIGPINPDDGFERATAAEKLTVIDDALTRIASNRSTLGAQQSRLNSAVSNLGTQIENYKGAISRIKDVDFAAETASFTQNRILSQAGASVLAQANQEPEIVMTLLR